MLNAVLRPLSRRPPSCGHISRWLNALLVCIEWFCWIKTRLCCQQSTPSAWKDNLPQAIKCCSEGLYVVVDQVMTLSPCYFRNDDSGCTHSLFDGPHGPHFCASAYHYHAHFETAFPAISSSTRLSICPNCLPLPIGSCAVGYWPLRTFAFTPTSLDPYPYNIKCHRCGR